MSIRSKRPWHLWLVGIVGILWNAMGVLDYVMTQTRNESYLSQFSAEELAYFFSIPTVVQIIWGIAVFGGLIGCVLLLLKMRSAIYVLLVSFLAMLGTTIHNFFIAEVKLSDVVGQEAIWMAGVIFIVALLLLVYARAMDRRGVLN